jgi:hypothetical protein
LWNERRLYQIGKAGLVRVRQPSALTVTTITSTCVLPPSQSKRSDLDSSLGGAAMRIGDAHPGSEKF